MATKNTTTVLAKLQQLAAAIPELEHSDQWLEIVQDLEYIVKQEPDNVKPEAPQLSITGTEKLVVDQTTYRALIRNANSIILRFDHDGYITFLNEFGRKFFGYSEAEIIGQNVIGTIVPETDEAGRNLANMIKDIIRNPEQYANNENENTRKNGDRVWISWSNQALFADDGSLNEILCVGNDVTELKRTEEILLQQKDFLSTVINALPLGVYAKDIGAEHRYSIWNNKIEDIFGIKREDILGKVDQDVFEKPEADYQRQTDETVIKAGKIIDVPMEEINTKHGPILAHTIKVPIYDDAGKPETLLGIVEDITDQKKIEAQLRESEKRLSEAQRIAKLGTWTLDITTGEFDWSERTYEIFGLPSTAEITLEKYQELIHPDDREKVSETLQEILVSKETTHQIEHRLVRPDGAIRYLSKLGSIINAEDGTPEKLLGVAQDITERKQSEEALRQAEEKYRSIFENAVEGIFQTSLEGRYLSANPALANIYGYDSPEELLASITDIQQQLYVDQKRRQEFTKLIVAQGSISDFESEIYRKDGRIIWISENARAVRDSQGQPLFYEGTVTDITQRKNTEQQILRQNEELAAFNRVAVAITSTSDSGDRLRNVIEEIVHLFKARRGVIALLNEAKIALTVVANYSTGLESNPEGYIIPLANNPSSSRVIETGQSIVIADAKNNVLTGPVRDLMRQMGTETLVIVPLIIRGEVIGTLSLDFDDPNQEFSPENIKLTETIASQVAGALENARLLEQTKAALAERKQAQEGLLKALEKTESLYRIGDTLATATDEQKTFETVLGEYLRLLSLKWGILALIDKPTNQTRIHAIYLDGKLVQGDMLTLPLDQPLTQHLIKHPEPLVIGDVFSNALTKDNIKIRSIVQAKSMLYTPLVLRGETIGVISVGCRQLNREFSQSDVEIGQVVADQLAIWLENRRLLVEAQYRSERLETAAKVSRAASSILDVDELINTSVNLIRDQFDFYYVGLFLVDEAKEWAVLHAGTGEAGRIQLENNHKLKVGDESMIGWSVHHRQARIALDVGQDAVRFKNPVLPETRSEMALPLISREEAIGALTVQSTAQGAFSDEDITLLQTMVDQLTNAIVNANLFESVAKSQKEAETRLQETLALQKLSHALSSTLSTNKILDIFFEACTQEIGFDYVQFSLVDKEQYRIKAVAGVGISDSQLKRANHALDSQDIMVDIITTGQTEIITGWDDRFDKENFEAEGHIDWVRIFTPITLRAEHIGLVEAGFNKNIHETIKNSQVRLLKAFINQTALALDNAYRYELSQRNAKREALIKEITTKVRASNNLDTILQTTIKEVGDALGSKRTYIHLNASPQKINEMSKPGVEE